MWLSTVLASVMPSRNSSPAAKKASFKTPDDKPLNAFGFDEAALPKAKTVEVIAETHAAWKGLRDGSIDAGKLWTGK